MVEQSSLNFSIQNFDHGCYYLYSVYTNVISSAKTRHVYTTTKFNFMTPAYRYNQWLLIPSVSIMLHINWSASLEVILPTLQSYDWNNSIRLMYCQYHHTKCIPLLPPIEFGLHHSHYDSRTAAHFANSKRFRLTFSQNFFRFTASQWWNNLPTSLHSIIKDQCNKLTVYYLKTRRL